MRFTRLLIFVALVLSVPALTRAADIRVVSSGGFAAAYRTLAPQFEQTTGNHLITGWGPSMGNTTDAVPQRLARNEPIDVVIMVGPALGKFVDEGKIIPDSRVDLARSAIGIAVRSGTPKPDISTIDSLRTTLLNAKSLAYSDSASGVYVSTELYRRLGIVDQLTGKSRMIPAEPVGSVIARGEAEIGFQQISELADSKLAPAPSTQSSQPTPSTGSTRSTPIVHRSSAHTPPPLLFAILEARVIRASSGPPFLP